MMLIGHKRDFFYFKLIGSHRFWLVIISFYYNWSFLYSNKNKCFVSCTQIFVILLFNSLHSAFSNLFVLSCVQCVYRAKMKIKNFFVSCLQLIAFSTSLSLFVRIKCYHMLSIMRSSKGAQVDAKRTLFKIQLIPSFM